MSNVLKSIIEQAITHHAYQAALSNLKKLTLSELLYFEEQSPIIADALIKKDWYYILFYHHYPLTAQRLKQAREAWILVEQFPSITERPAQTFPDTRFAARSEQEMGRDWSTRTRESALFRENTQFPIAPDYDPAVYKRMVAVRVSNESWALK